MALLTTQVVGLAGVTPTFAAATGGGDTFTPADDRMWIEVKNGSGSPITVTVVTPGSIRGQAIGDVTVSVPATTGDKIIGPFDPSDFADPTTGLVSITYSGVTSLTIGVFQLSRPSR